MLEKIYQHEENCILEEMEGEALIYNPSAATTLHLNPPSVMVWHMLDGERSVLRCSSASSNRSENSVRLCSTAFF